ncbi:hypothetical protein HYT57_02285 [Candidatus Woesearchaeota archaeon]|nr:hypothetical protein [Candidatus Woesearchaeota archaeon]
MINIDNIICAYENEIIHWIKENYKELGYDEIIEENKDKVPDFIMLRKDKKVKVEVEIYSSSFIKHKHNSENVDEVLCVIKDADLPAKTIKIQQLRLWYELQGDDLVGFFKEMPDTILVNHKTGQTINHFQDEWTNLSAETESKIIENLRLQSNFLHRKRSA